MKRAGKEISQVIVQQKKHAFLGNEILRKMHWKEQCRKREAEKD
jgi:hypothetical protein